MGVRHLRGGSAALSYAFRKRDFGRTRGILGLGKPDKVPEMRPRVRSAGCGEGEGPPPGGGRAPRVTGDGREWALSENGEGAGAELARGPFPTPGRTVPRLIARHPQPRFSLCEVTRPRRLFSLLDLLLSVSFQNFELAGLRHACWSISRSSFPHRSDASLPAERAAHGALTFHIFIKQCLQDF